LTITIRQFLEKKSNTIKIGLVGIDLDTCWLQFDVLIDKLTGYLELIKNRITDFGVEVAKKNKEFNSVFDVSPECETTEIERASRTSVARVIYDEYKIVQDSKW